MHLKNRRSEELNGTGTVMRQRKDMVRQLLEAKK
jgi:hypothetical protein